MERANPATKGLVDFLLSQLSVKKQAEEVLLPSFGLAAEMISEVKALLSSHTVYRDKFGFAHTMIPRQFFARVSTCSQEVHIVHC